MKFLINNRSSVRLLVLGGVLALSNIVAPLAMACKINLPPNSGAYLCYCDSDCACVCIRIG
jgi:hypothetical protein